MKTILKFTAIAGLLATTALSASAQQVTFFTPNGGASNPILDVSGMPAPGPNHVAQIYWGTSADFASMTPIGSPVALPSGGGAGFVNSGAVDVTGASFNQMIHYSIGAWDSTTGGTFESATIRGNSTPVALTLGADALATPPNVNTFASFQLQTVVVPEPSTIALGIIGGLALLLRRRRS